MTFLKNTIQQKHSIFYLLSISTLFCFLLLAIRIQITQKLFYGFLVWNLFLAAVPYAITIYLCNKPKLKKLELLIGFSFWLAFLPNAPYIVTDFVHLKLSSYSIIYLDILMVFLFAANGLAFFYLSLIDLLKLIQPYFNKNVKSLVTLSLIFLSSFGVYLGRFLRYNSWELLSNPKLLFNDIWLMISQPIEHKEVWSFTLCFGLFLALGFKVIKHLMSLDKA